MQRGNVLISIMLAVVVVVALSAAAVAQTPTPSQGATPASDVTIASDSLHGTKVFDTDGKELGTISRLLVGTDGRVASVVIKHGGMAGLGGKEMVVPWDALKLQRGDRDRVIATLQRELLEKAPSASPATEERERRR